MAKDGKGGKRATPADDDAATDATPPAAVPTDADRKAAKRAAKAERKAGKAARKAEKQAADAARKADKQAAKAARKGEKAVAKAAGKPDWAWRQVVDAGDAFGDRRAGGRPRRPRA